MTSLLSVHMCVLLLLCQSYTCVEGNGAGWEPAAYRMRRHYELKGDSKPVSFARLKEILDLGDKIDLREDDHIVTVQGTTVRRLVEVYQGAKVKGSHIDVSVRHDGEIDRFGGKVTKGLEKEAEKKIKCKVTKEELLVIIEKSDSDFFRENVVHSTLTFDMQIDAVTGAAIHTVEFNLVVFNEDTDVIHRPVFIFDVCLRKIIGIEDHTKMMRNRDDEHSRKKRSRKSRKHKRYQTFKSRLAETDSANWDDSTSDVTHTPVDEDASNTDHQCQNPAQGIGGNEKTGMITYGSNGRCLEPLVVSSDGVTCFLNNSYIRVVDLKHGANKDPYKIANFPCADGYDDEQNGAYSAALDAFYYATQVAKMYRELYNYSPLSSPIPRAFVHFGGVIDNALWDGENLILGDGSDETFPYSVLDTIAHEMAHGITERSSGLVYKGQSGAIAESFSDMAGEIAEVYVKGANDWLVGGELLKEEGDAIRFFEDPDIDGKSIGHLSKYTVGMKVHHASGIFNKAFFLASQKLGIIKAFQAFLVANRMYWTPEETFESAACTVVKAAVDEGLDVNTFMDVFNDVGVVLTRCPFVDDFILPITKSDVRPSLRLSSTTQPTFRIDVPKLGVLGLTARSQGGTNTRIYVSTYPSESLHQSFILTEASGDQGLTINLLEPQHDASGDAYNGDYPLYIYLKSDDIDEVQASLTVNLIKTADLLNEGNEDDVSFENING